MNTGANAPRARQGPECDVTPPAPVHYIRDPKNGLSQFDPRRCSNERAAEAYRLYQLAHRESIMNQRGKAAPFHFPYAHRTVAEWGR